MFKLVKTGNFLLPEGWRYDYIGILLFSCIQAWTLIKLVKSGADRTLYG